MGCARIDTCEMRKANRQMDDCNHPGRALNPMENDRAPLNGARPCRSHHRYHALLRKMNLQT
jgi:hypothetical protein